MTNISFFRSVLEQDSSPIVLCDLKHTIVYMNPAAEKRYARQGGPALLGKNLLNCHASASAEKINRIVAWFIQSKEHNCVYTFYNESENKDVYMVALRDESGELIGYYEKHSYRNRETAKLYDMK